MIQQFEKLQSTWTLKSWTSQMFGWYTLVKISSYSSSHPVIPDKRIRSLPAAAKKSTIVRFLVKPNPKYDTK